MNDLRWPNSIARGALAFLCLSLPALAQTTAAVDLSGASLEDLMNIQVTSVSKKEQPLSKAACAIYVITQDDIRRSGATNMPDLLRMVPGVNVARITANVWAISIRGFNYRYSTKVLVLIDGRSVYTSLFTGVYWDQQSMPLEDIERIEVIRGPGGTMWGANAMNGVINIITKAADKTLGTLISLEGGWQDLTQDLAQYGGTAGKNGAYRIFGRYTLNANSPSDEQPPAQDGGHSLQMGYRSDWSLTPKDSLTIEANLFGASENQTITTTFFDRLPNPYVLNDSVKASNGSILGRWNHEFSNGSTATLQTYYNRLRRIDLGEVIENTGDIEFQYHFLAGKRNDIVTGLGYRVTDQRFHDGYSVKVRGGGSRDYLLNSFIQDEFTLTNRLALTAGLKLEHNSYTGFEFEPSIRLAYSVNNRQTLWASAARAIQQPSLLYAASQINLASVPLPDGSFAIYQINGNPAAKAPVLYDYELGYRAEISKKLTLDASVFLSDYSRLQSTEVQPPVFISTPPPPHLVLENVFGNSGRARNYGIEFSAHWNVTSWWRLSPGFNTLQMNLSLEPGSTDVTLATVPGDSPRRQAQLRSDINLPHSLEWNTSLYYTGKLEIGPVPAYTRLDTNLIWHVGESVDIIVAGQNLLSPRHFEFLDSTQVHPTQVGRDVYTKLVWRF